MQEVRVHEGSTELPDETTEPNVTAEEENIVVEQEFTAAEPPPEPTHAVTAASPSAPFLDNAGRLDSTDSLQSLLENPQPEEVQLGELESAQPCFESSGGSSPILHSEPRDGQTPDQMVAGVISTTGEGGSLPTVESVPPFFSEETVLPDNGFRVEEPTIIFQGGSDKEDQLAETKVPHAEDVDNQELLLINDNQEGDKLETVKHPTHAAPPEREAFLQELEHQKETLDREESSDKPVPAVTSHDDLQENVPGGVSDVMQQDENELLETGPEPGISTVSVPEGQQRLEDTSSKEDEEAEQDNESFYQIPRSTSEVADITEDAPSLSTAAVPRSNDFEEDFLKDEHLLKESGLLPLQSLLYEGTLAASRNLPEDDLAILQTAGMTEEAGSHPDTPTLPTTATYQSKDLEEGFMAKEQMLEESGLLPLQTSLYESTLAASRNVPEDVLDILGTAEVAKAASVPVDQTSEEVPRLRSELSSQLDPVLDQTQSFPSCLLEESTTAMARLTSASSLLEDAISETESVTDAPDAPTSTADKGVEIQSTGHDNQAGP